MLRTIIALTAVLIPAAAFAADAPAPQILERDGMTFEYTTAAAPFGGVIIKGRELPSAATSTRKSFTLFVSPKGKVTGDYAGSSVEFQAANFNPAIANAAAKDARVTTATQVASK